MDVTVRRAVPGDAQAIAGIYNQAVRGSTATFDTEEKTAEERLGWLEKRTGHQRVLVAEADSIVVGWGALSAYSDRAAYDSTTEISIYIDEGWRQQGIGSALGTRLLAEARALGVHVVLARICTENEGSLQLSRNLGFDEVGTLHEVGRKFDRWLDVAIFELRFER